MTNLLKLLCTKENKSSKITFTLVLTFILLDPHITHAAQTTEVLQPATFPTTIEKITEAQTKQKLASADELKKTDSKVYLVDLLEDYLNKKNSPLAKCSNVILEQANWKKIVARSAAESAFGVRSTPGKYNAWGVMAGSGLKKMGNNWCESVVAMDDFFDNYPKNAKVKYAQMTIEQECGIYKQPCGFDEKGRKSHHWIDNNKAIIADMTGLEEKATQLAQDHVDTLHSQVALAK